MDASYKLDEWAAATTRGRRIFNSGYGFSGNEFKGWNLSKTTVLREGRDVAQTIYLWQSSGDPERELVRIAIIERDDWRLAQESLHEHLMQCAKPAIPMGARRQPELGDVVFESREPRTDLPAAIAFTRGNVCVLTSSVGDRNVDVSWFASRIDAHLGESPAKMKPEKGRIRALTPSTATVKAKQETVLFKNLGAAGQRGKWLKMVVPDGELKRKGKTLVYSSAEGGKKQVQKYTVSIARPD